VTILTKAELREHLMLLAGEINQKMTGGRGMTDFIPREGEAICKVCGMPHLIDEWKGVEFYICPETERVYLVAKEKKND
jgi:hypothetical protein